MRGHLPAGGDETEPFPEVVGSVRHMLENLRKLNPTQKTNNNNKTKKQNHKKKTETQEKETTKKKEKENKKTQKNVDFIQVCARVVNFDIQRGKKKKKKKK